MLTLDLRCAFFASANISKWHRACSNEAVPRRELREKHLLIADLPARLAEKEVERPAGDAGTTK
jgi:hypothetical protein